MNGSDMPPSVGSYDPFIGSKKVEQDYLDIEAQLQWPNPILSNASEVASEITGPTGVKMLGPYEWVPPIYWTTDNHRAGGAWSFATEISPGPAVPPLDSLKQMLGSDHLWPMDEVWMYHTGGGEFSNLDVFNAALNARYGLATSALDYSEKAQVMAYESHRAMFEAYSANKYRSTGVIQWMLNNAWPSMIWHLYDYYLRPGGSYFGTKTALQPIHVQYSYNNHSIFVVNSTLKSYENLWVTADIYNLDGKSLYHDKSSMNIKADGAIKVLVIPTTLNLPTTYFLRLTLTDTDNKVLDLNTYWLSTSRDLLNWNNSDWYYTPVAKYADFTSLQSLPTVNLTVSDQIEQQDDEQIQTITITNPGTNIAFFIHLTITRGTGGEELLPVLWEDNYFTLLPGESRTVRATYLVSDLGTDTPVLAWDCWNNIEGK
jgi:exo-1,4-beta-D-glucosaminidase